MNELTKKTEIQEIDSLTLTGHFAVFTIDEHYFAGEQGVLANKQFDYTQ